MYKIYNMKIIPFILLCMFILPESIIPNGKTDAFPMITETNITTSQESLHFEQNVTTTDRQDPLHHQYTPRQSNVVPTVDVVPPPIICDVCKFIANGFNETVLHNPKVIAFVTEDLEQICSVLPQSVQALCSAAVNQTAPIIINRLGDFIATEGCMDLGVCHSLE